MMDDGCVDIVCMCIGPSMRPYGIEVGGVDWGV